MRVRVAPNLMAAARELTHLVGGQKARRSDPSCGDEVMASPTSALERFGASECRGAAVVERQGGHDPVLQETHRYPSASNRIEVSLELIGVELIAGRCRAWKAVAIPFGSGGNVVVSQRDRHGFTDLACVPRRRNANHGA